LKPQDPPEKQKEKKETRTKIGYKLPSKSKK
jgi:hypothetical protein